MKKLMTMIAAVGMAFGLFAADEQQVVSYQTSFETGDPGVTGTTFLPESGWTGIADPGLTLEAYANDAYEYDETGANVRRDGFIDQYNYLPLSTSGAEVTRTVNDAVLDQLVKFTGFEDDAEVSDDAKIAVWMKGTEDDEDASGETNLYVTVAKVAAAGVTKESFKLVNPKDEAWETEKWYRLTIKKIGDIYGGNAITDTARGGFVIYVDGLPVSAENATDLIYCADELTSDAKGYMAKGQLFPAYDTTDVAFKTVSYKGIGAIDDIVIDNLGPVFAQVVNRTFTVTPGEGLTEDVTVTLDGKEVDPDEDGNYTVQDGKKIVVTWTLDPAYKLMNPVSLAQEVTVGADTTDIEPDSSITDEIAEIYATKVNGQTTSDFAESELFTMISGFANGDVATFLYDAQIVDGDGNSLYGFITGTTITVAIADDVTTWTINVPGESAWIDDYVGAPANFAKVYTFVEADGEVGLYGDVVSEFTAQKVSDASETGIEVSGTLTAGVLTVGTGITLSGAGKVITTTDELELLPEGEVEKLTDTPATGLFTYQIKQGFTVEVPEAEANTKLAVTIDDVAAGDTNGVYTVAKASTLTAVYTADEGYELNGQGEWTVTYATKDTEITAPTATILTFTLQVTGNDTVDVTVAPDEETYNWGTEVKVTVAPKTDYQFSGDYEGWDKEGNNLVSNFVIKANTEITAPTATAIPYVALVGEDKFLTAVEALAKVQELEKDSANFPIVAKALIDGLAVVGPNGQQIVLAKDETITINANSWEFSSGVTISQGPIALAAGATFTVVGQIAKTSFSVPADYKLVETNNGDGTYTYTAVACDYVAQIGADGQKFETLAEAINAVTVGTPAKITLLKNCGENVSIPVGKEIELDFAGFTLTGQNSTYTINNNGTLTLGGNGTVQNAVYPKNTLIRNGANAKMTINNGTYVSARIVIKNDENNNKAQSISGTGGTLVINDGTFTTEGDGEYNWDALQNWGTATINGGTFNGVIECAAYDYWQGGVATITGGTFNSKVITIAYFNGDAAPTFNPSISVTGGTFEYPVYRNIGPYADNPNPDNYYDVDTAVLPEPYASASNKGAMVLDGTAKFKVKPADAVVATNKKYVENEGYWTIKAIEYATLAVTADEGITYTLTNKTTEAVVEAGYKADIDNAEVIEAVELGFEEGYELDPASTTSVTLDAAETKTIVLKKQLKTFDITFTDGAEWTNVVSTVYGATPDPTEQVPEKAGYTFTGWNPAITAVTGAATYTAVYTVNQYDVTFSTNNIPVAEVATKVAHGATLEAGQIPSFTGGTWDVDPATAVITCATNFNYTIAAEEPVNPGEEKSYETEKEAQDAAKNINDHKDTMINVPTQASGDKAAYLARVAAKVVDGTKVVVDIAADKEATFKAELDTEIKKADVAAALTDAKATKATITTVPGFYYWVEGGVEVGTIKTNGEAVIGDGSTVELTKPALGTTTKAFYKLAVGVKDPAK